MTCHVIPLHGCTPEPLGNYLKALGVFRLVAEQADSAAIGWWRDGFFWIGSKWSGQEILDFFITGIEDSEAFTYAPTPIFAPWGGRPGLYKDGNKEARSRLARLLIQSRRNPRFRGAAETIRAIRGILRENDWLKTKPRKEKLKLLMLSRASWPASAVAWFDACLSIEEDARFGFLYGTGGNEGSADITNNFWELIEEVIGLPAAKSYANETLASSLFGTGRASGTSRTAGQLFPSAAGSYNSGQAFFGSTSTNPWDVILMMEGCVLFAAARTKRLSQNGKGKAAFPFMLDYAATGEPQTTVKDERKQDARIVRCRAEFWMPLWGRPMGLSELQALLAEGRLQRGQGETAGHSVQAMEAVSSLGVSRGIQAFNRAALFERRGKGYYLASSLGIYPVPRKLSAITPLLSQLDMFRDQAHRNLREGPRIPDRVIFAKQRLNAAIADVLRKEYYKDTIDADRALRVLSSVSDLENEVATLAKGRKRLLTPSQFLSTKWHQHNLQATEYRLARAIAGIAPWGEREYQGRKGSAVESIRANLLPLSRIRNTWKWADVSRSAVWARGANLLDNLSGSLRRRLIDATKGQGDGLPLWSGYGAHFSDLLRLWDKDVDEGCLAELIHALALIDTGDWGPERIGLVQKSNEPTPPLHSNAVWFDNENRPHIKTAPIFWQDRSLISEEELDCAFGLPRVYALLKLCFIGGRLPARPVERIVVQRTGEEPFPPQAAEILNLLSNGRLSEAVVIAARKLRARGYPTILDPGGSGGLDIEMGVEECRRLAGMLLIPVRHPGVLAGLSIKPRTANR